ncbi:MAG: copper resistance protein CopC [Acidimicrobiia bacterium]
MKIFYKKFITLFIASLIFSFTIILVNPSSAYAHSQITGSNPGPDETLVFSPKYIELKFSESITATRNSIRLYDQNAKQIELASKTTSVNSTDIHREIPSLNRGIYIVSWSVTSADTHPVKGAYTFSIGEKNKQIGDIDKRIAQVLQGNSISKETKVFALINKWFLFAALSLMIAITVLCFFKILKYSADLNKYLLLSLVVVLITTFIGLVVQTSFVQEVSLITALKPNLFFEQMRSHYGLASLLRIIFAVILYFVLTKMNKSFLILALILCIDVAVTVSLSGHAVAGEYVSVAIVLSVIHVMSTFTWLGSILLIATRYKSIRNQINFKKFSKCAMICVALAFMTGAFAWYRQIGPWVYATNSFFGKLVIAKIVFVIATVIAAFFARKKVLSSSVENSKFRKLVSFEALVLLIVLGMTSVLVSAVPAKQSANVEISKQIQVSNKILQITVDPAKTGVSQLHVYLYKKNGVPFQFDQSLNNLQKSGAEVTLSNPQKNIGPLDVNMRFQGLNHYSSTGLQVPFAGTWTITVRVQIDKFNEVTGSFKVKYL